jgi:hypothetical protein
LYILTKFQISIFEKFPERRFEFILFLIHSKPNLKRNSESLISKTILHLNFQLSFKIILIQKFQSSAFSKCLNMFEYENRFDLNLNFGFQIKSYSQKFWKLFYLCLQPKLILAQNPWQPKHSSFYFHFLHTAHYPAFSAQRLAHPASTAIWPTSPSCQQPSATASLLAASPCSIASVHRPCSSTLETEAESSASPFTSPETGTPKT